MKRELSGSVVVVTGASSGIGRATALAFARRGANLVLAARDAEVLAGVARECEQTYGVTAISAPTDVRDEGNVDALAGIAMERFGRVDVWVNDAAVYMMGTLEACPTAAVREMFDINVMGVLHGIRAALACMCPRGRGTIINVGSLAGKVSYADAGIYCATKHAVHALTETLRQELRGSGIDACLVVPASIDTPLFQHAANYTGREVLAMRPIYRAKRVAEAIVACAERPRRQIYVGSAARIMTFMDRFMPWLYERLQPVLVRRDHLGRGGVPASDGNLLAPKDPHDIEGGWRARRSPTEKALASVRTRALPDATSGG